MKRQEELEQKKKLEEEARKKKIQQAVRWCTSLYLVMSVGVAELHLVHALMIGKWKIFIIFFLMLYVLVET